MTTKVIFTHPETHHRVIVEHPEPKSVDEVVKHVRDTDIVRDIHTVVQQSK